MINHPSVYQDGDMTSYHENLMKPFQVMTSRHRDVIIYKYDIIVQ